MGKESSRPGLRNGQEIPEESLEGQREGKGSISRCPRVCGHGYLKASMLHGFLKLESVGAYERRLDTCVRIPEARVHAAPRSVGNADNSKVRQKGTRTWISG